MGKKKPSKGPKKQRKATGSRASGRRRSVAIGAVVAVTVAAAFVAWGLSGDRKTQSASAPAAGASTSAAASAALAARAKLPEPPQDGLPLYRFLLAKIPHVVSKVSCKCCGKKLAWCYKGGCPPT